MNINPVSRVHPGFGSWIERRRKRMEAQLSALEEERYGDLAVLIGDDDQDRPPDPESETERDEYRRMLKESIQLSARLALVRGRLLEELKDVERMQQNAGPVERRSSRGGSLDGYL
jgi:hypothetical protein